MALAGRLLSGTPGALCNGCLYSLAHLHPIPSVVDCRLADMKLPALLGAVYLHPLSRDPNVLHAGQRQRTLQTYAEWRKARGWALCGLADAKTRWRVEIAGSRDQAALTDGKIAFGQSSPA